MGLAEMRNAKGSSGGIDCDYGSSQGNLPAKYSAARRFISAHFPFFPKRKITLIDRGALTVIFATKIADRYTCHGIWMGNLQ